MSDETKPDLELVTTHEMLAELTKRCQAIVVLMLPVAQANETSCNTEFYSRGDVHCRIGLAQQFVHDALNRS